MPKILWVALPLLLAAAFLALQLLRGRAPSRTAINIVSSVLLLAYVAATAGLGIFWVANQQLPVFDWHYLFGYGTVVLVSLHLVFNFPAVWRWFARRAERDREASTARRPLAAGATRRGLLATLGVLAATGAAFVLGLRHGRSELKVETAAGGVPTSVGAATAGTGGGDAATALALVERFHAFSTHTRAGLLTRSPSAGWGEPPPPFKRHAGASREPLPTPTPTTATATAPATARAGRLDLASLGALLWHTAGVTENRGGLVLRASPSSGALFATELYLLARALPGLAAGTLHYDPESHALERLGAASPEALPAAALEDGAAGEAPVLLVATAIFQRSGHKYRDRTYRYVLADLGHALENLRVAAEALALPARFVSAFDEARLAGVLGIDEAEEGVLAVVAVGPSSARQVQAATPALRWQIAMPRQPASKPAASASSRVSSPEVTASMHAATSLRALAQARPTAASNALPPPAASSKAADVVALPAAELVEPDWLRLIAARRSVRRYAGAPLRLADLAAVLARMAAEAGPPLSPAVRIDVVVHAVDGLEPGAYRYRPAEHALLHRRRLASSGRAATRAAALDQDVIGDAAAVLVLAIDRAAFAADPLGPARGYRHAFLEAGRVGERVYLEAAARGLGTCAVGAFYDDEAAALVGIDPTGEWVVHFAALGVRA